MFEGLGFGFFRVWVWGLGVWGLFRVQVQG